MGLEHEQQAEEQHVPLVREEDARGSLLNHSCGIIAPGSRAPIQPQLSTTLSAKVARMMWLSRSTQTGVETSRLPWQRCEDQRRSGSARRIREIETGSGAWRFPPRCLSISWCDALPWATLGVSRRE